MIETTGLTKNVRGTPVLRGLDLDIASGEIFALLGPNGAGKTTTVRVLSTLSRPDAGRVRVAGLDVRAEPRAVRRRIALTGQFAAVDEAQTGRENLQMMGRLTRLSRPDAHARTQELLVAFDLVDSADRRVATYSGGMRRRLDLAASLVGRPSVLFLDEPTTGLDPRSRQQMWSVVAGLATEGTTVLLTTQYLEEADRLAGRIAVLDRGRIVAQGTAAQLKAAVGGFRLELVAADEDAFECLRARVGDRVRTLDRATRTLVVPVENEAAQIRRLLDSLDPDGDLVRRFALHSASLDDAFLALTGHAAKESPHA